MKDKTLNAATSITMNTMDLLDMLLDGKLANVTIDLGSHEMYLETREKVELPKGVTKAEVDKYMTANFKEELKKRADMGGDLPEIPKHLKPEVRSKV